MIQATKRPDPPERPYQERECSRCGIRWMDWHSNWVRSAPCFDCRVILKREGVDVRQYKKAKAA